MTDSAERIVTIFGGSKCVEGDEEYGQAKRVGQLLAESGFTMFFIGIAVLMTTVLIVLVVGYYLLKIPYDDLVGVASGATGNPAILVYSTRMAPTERPDIGYAMIFPSMTIVKVIAVQIVGLLVAAGASGG